MKTACEDCALVSEGRSRRGIQMHRVRYQASGVGPKKKRRHANTYNKILQPKGGWIHPRPPRAAMRQLPPSTVMSAGSVDQIASAAPPPRVPKHNIGLARIKSGLGCSAAFWAG